MKTVGLFKRLIIIVYDGLLLVGVAMVFLFIVMALFMLIAPESFFVNPADLEDAKLVQLSDTGRSVGGIVFTLSVLLISFLFYGWFWTHGGQTLGMKAWNLYLIKPDGKFVSWPIAAKRYAAALLSWAALGAGFLWIVLNKQQRAWHDIISGTQIVCMPPKPKSKK